MVKFTEMGKIAFLTITDAHLNRNSPKVRVNMRAEVEFVERKLIEVINNYISKEYKVVLLFLGDIFHGAVPNGSDHTYFNNYFHELESLCLAIFVNVGNHDLNSKKNNPFYSLFRTVESKNLLAYAKLPIVPEGFKNIIRIIDKLEIGDTNIMFNHYGVPIQMGEVGKRNIGLFHADIVCKSVVKSMEQQIGTSIFTDEDKLVEFDDVGGNFYNYDISFFGHLHSIFGMWEIGEVKKNILYYLASLVRTKENEISDTFLRRDIPAILFEDLEFKGFENNYFDLMDRSTTVNETKVIENKIKYKAIRKSREVRSIASIERNPIIRLTQKVSHDNYLDLVLKDLIETEDSLTGMKFNILQDLAELGVNRYE